MGAVSIISPRIGGEEDDSLIRIEMQARAQDRPSVLVLQIAQRTVRALAEAVRHSPATAEQVAPAGVHEEAEQALRKPPVMTTLRLRTS